MCCFSVWFCLFVLSLVLVSLVVFLFGLVCSPVWFCLFGLVGFSVFVVAICSSVLFSLVVGSPVLCSLFSLPICFLSCVHPILFDLFVDQFVCCPVLFCLLTCFVLFVSVLFGCFPSLF